MGRRLNLTIEAVEEAERQRKPDEALRVAAEGAERVLPPGLASPRPKNIIDSRFDKERCSRAICCDECQHWFRGNAVGSFWNKPMPAAESRREAWERGDWDASWYCIACCADHWDCSDQEVMEYLGFSKRQFAKDQFMRARAVSASTGPANPPKARKPASITDSRFEKQRELRQTLCDQCNEPKSGNQAGAFCHRENMPRAGDRKEAWECGDWDASWYCTACYMQYYRCSYEEVLEKLGFTERAGKKARYARGKA